MHAPLIPPPATRAVASIVQRVIPRRVVCRLDEGVFLEGDKAACRYEVVTGAVRACRLLPDGRRRGLEFFLPGDPFGHDDLDAHYGYTAEAAGIDGTGLNQYRQPPLA